MKTLRSKRWLFAPCLLCCGLTIGLAQQSPPDPIRSARERFPSTSFPAPRSGAEVSAPSTSTTTVSLPAEGNRDTTLPPPAVRLSPWASEMVKLVEAGIEDRVVLSFIANSGMFNLGADQLIHLSAAGVSSEVLSAMLQHDTDLASGARILTTTAAPPLDPELARILLTVRNAAREADAPPADSSRPGPAASQEFPEVERAVFVPEASPLSARPETDRDAIAVRHATDLFKTAVPASKIAARAKQSGGYRVPETRSVQLLPPIIVVNSASPPPNVIIIEMFPSSR